MSMTKTIVCVSLALGLGACASETGPEPQPRSDETVASDAVTAGSWRAEVSQQVEQIQARDPAFYERVLRLEPTATRDGQLRFIDPVVREADTTPIFLHRLQTTGEDTMVRAALAEALPRTGGDSSVAMPDLIAAEKDDWVRGALVTALRMADSEHALAGLRLALDDEVPNVRAAAAVTASRRQDGTQLVPELVAQLADADLTPRVEAIRALGALKATDALASLPGHLDSVEADERLHALRAIDRIDPAVVTALTELDALMGDPDPRVVRAAQKIAARR
jgi:hypothetical protein